MFQPFTPASAGGRVRVTGRARRVVQEDRILISSRESEGSFEKWANVRSASMAAFFARRPILKSRRAVETPPDRKISREKAHLSGGGSSDNVSEDGKQSRLESRSAGYFPETWWAVAEEVP